MQRRPPVPYGVAAFLSLGAGLLDRPLRHHYPGVLTKGLGDALWSLLVYFLVCLLRSKWLPRRVFAAALAFSFAIEFSQLYHAPWIDAIRRTLLGGLILGWGFAWGDLVSYVIGCIAGFSSDVMLLNREPSNVGYNNNVHP